jgi:hypothetical protein
VSVQPSNGRGISVTVKYGAGYEAPWAVFHGSAAEVRADVIDYFGIAAADVAGLSLSDLVVNAGREARGIATVAQGLDATVVASPQAPTAPAAQSAATAADPWTEASAAPAPAEPEPPAEHPLITRIKNAPDVPTLQRIWAADRDAFSDPEIMQAWKTRGRELSSAA